MGIFILVVILPESILVLLSYYLGNPGFSVKLNTLFIYLIPVAGSFLPFIYAKHLSRTLTRKEVHTYILTVGLSMLSIFFNSAILLLWKFNAGFYALIPLFVSEPLVALYFISFNRKLRGSLK